MSDRELIIGNWVHTMRDPAFIAGLVNTFDGTKAPLRIIQNLPKRRLVNRGDLSTTFIVTCNKKADLIFTWQTSNVINFPSTDITDIASASQVAGVDLVTITNTVASGKSSFEISRIGDRFLKQYIRCKVDYAYGGEEEFSDSSCDTTDGSTTITCDSSNNIAVGQYLSGIGIPVGSKVETVGFTNATCDIDDDPTIEHDADARIVAGLTVTGTGIPAGAVIDSINSGTSFELSAATTGGDLDDQTLTFGSAGIAALLDTTPTPTGFWQKNQTATTFDATSTTGNGIITGSGKATFSRTTDAEGLPTISIVTKGLGFAIGDTILLTDPGSTSETATITVSNVAVTSFTITTAATETNGGSDSVKLTFHGETVISNSCLIRLTEGDDPSINDIVTPVHPKQPRIGQ